MTIIIRDEQSDDTQSIHSLTRSAFHEEAHSSNTEHYIVDALREAGALSISMVAERDSQIIGHVAISPVTVSDGSLDWFGLGPISVLPADQGKGIGSLLMQNVIGVLQERAAGCVLLGNPDFYGRFGFSSTNDLELAGVPPRYFQALFFRDADARGMVEYHQAFSATA